MFEFVKVKHTAIIFLGILAFGIFAQISFAANINVGGVTTSTPVQCNPETDLSCPREGGLIPCGRNSNDPSTPIDETQQCTFCHFFYLGDNIITFLFSKFLPVIAMFFVVLSGVLIAISRGSPNQFKLGKEMAVWTLSGLAIVLVSFILANTFFTAIGAKKWTGLVGSRGEFDVVISQTEFQDSARTGNRAWQADEWKDALITLKNPAWKDKEVRKITSNTENSVVLDEKIPAVSGGISYTIGGWWQFACGISEPVPAPAPPVICPNFAFNANELTFLANCSEFPICTTENTVELEWRSPQGQNNFCNTAVNTNPIQSPPAWNGKKERNGTEKIDITGLALPTSITFGLSCDVGNTEVLKTALVKKDQSCALVAGAPKVTVFQIQTGGAGGNQWLDGPGPFVFNADHPLVSPEKKLEDFFSFKWASENAEICKGLFELDKFILGDERGKNGESIRLSLGGNVITGTYRYGIVCTAGNFSDSKIIDVCNENCNKLVR